MMKTAMAVKTATDMFGVLYWCRSSVRAQRKISGCGDVGAIGRSRATWRRSRVGETRNRRCRRSCRNLSGRVYYILLLNNRVKKRNSRRVWVGASPSRRRSEQPASRQTRVSVFCVSTTMSGGQSGRKSREENGEKMSSMIGFWAGNSR